MHGVREISANADSCVVLSSSTTLPDANYRYTKQVSHVAIYLPIRINSKPSSLLVQLSDPVSASAHRSID
jgi:hypothetical protein